MTVTKTLQALTNGGLVGRILDDVAHCVMAQTGFRRILVTHFADPIELDVADSKTRITAFASRGLAPEEIARLRAHVEHGGHVTGARFPASCRRGGSYFFPNGRGVPATALRLTSDRRYLSATGWASGDVLLTPLCVDGTAIGQISVDDPSDGLRPTPYVLDRLDELAAMTAVALRDARELEQLEKTTRVYQTVTESAMSGVLVIDGDLVRYVNQRACELLGYPKQDLLSLRPWWQVVHPDDRPLVWSNEKGSPQLHGTLRALRRDGRLLWLSSCSYPMEDDGENAFVLHFFDITLHIETETQLKEQALRDPLTGLLNRSYFEEAILREVDRSTRYKRPLTLMMADLTRFKDINDRLGHQAGDQILIGVASVFRDALRDSDWVVRYGGDEFLFVLPETGPDLGTLEDRLRSALRAWCEEESPGFPVDVDFGWATWTPEEARSVAELVREADTMLYEKKRARSAGR